MIYVGIDVAKDKHDCSILDRNGIDLCRPFSFPNNRDGFNRFFSILSSLCPDMDNVKVGLEATGHYSFNILGFLLDKGLHPFVLNPLHTSLYRNSLSLRLTKTDRTDAHTIALMIMSDVNLKSYSDISYHNEELKALCRYRFDKVKDRAALKVSFSRLVNILFSELETLVPTLHMASVYALLSEFPGASFIASAHLKRLSNLLYTASKGHYGRDTAIIIREAARSSIGSVMSVYSMELKHTIALISELDKEIDDIETEIKAIMDKLSPSILSIPGINFRMGAMLISEIGDISRFTSPDKLLAYAGLSPSTYQSGKLTASYSHMEKRGSRYLRYALFNAAKFVCIWDKNFSAYLSKKRAEGKHYNVAISHAAKKLVRLIWHLLSSGETYIA